MQSSLALQTPSELRSLPSSSINLLPFHLAHTGPAPVSTYFLPRDPPVEAPSDPRFASAQAEAGPSKQYTPGKLAAFRGRRVQAHEIPLPEGYVGLVLAAPPIPTSRTEDVPIPTSRATPRKSAATRVIEDEVDEAYKGGLRRSPRKRKAEAIANPRGTKRLLGLAKPAAPAKRFSLDSDDEEEEDGSGAGHDSLMQVDDPDDVETEVDGETSTVEGASALGSASAAISRTATVLTASLAGEESLAVIEQTVTIDSEGAETAEGEAVVEQTQQAAPRAVTPPPVVEDPVQEPHDHQIAVDNDDIPIELAASPVAIPSRQLVATATFPALTLWYPDGPLEADGERDEYIRAMHEWVALSREMMAS